eukprot:GHVR01019695.1.p1 GENE.GHVR01019695.1~~GHVR01019695.1.p1  ORF type:complete len:179 (+),score=32.69 GHVR01019695.1:91-627(+)
MRLTVDLIENGYQIINPNKDRTLILRGLKIPHIENIGSTQDFFACIDLSDNDLLKLNNLPPLKRLKTLILANNRITRIQDDLGHMLPQLVSLILTNNYISNLADLVPLTEVKTLERLSLLDNPVSKIPHMRAYLVHTIPSLRFFNFDRITQKERETVKEFFEGEEGGDVLLRAHTRAV